MNTRIFLAIMLVRSAGTLAQTPLAYASLDGPGIPATVQAPPVQPTVDHQAAEPVAVSNAVEPAAPRTTSDCSRWSVRSTAIGMTIADIKSLDRKLKVTSVHKDMLPLGPAQVWWQWAEDRWKGKW